MTVEQRKKFELLEHNLLEALTHMDKWVDRTERGRAADTLMTCLPGILQQVPDSQLRSLKHSLVNMLNSILQVMNVGYRRDLEETIEGQQYNPDQFRRIIDVYNARLNLLYNWLDRLQTITLARVDHHRVLADQRRAEGFYNKGHNPLRIRQPLWDKLHNKTESIQQVNRLHDWGTDVTVTPGEVEIFEFTQ